MARKKKELNIQGGSPTDYVQVYKMPTTKRGVAGTRARWTEKRPLKEADIQKYITKLITDNPMDPDNKVYRVDVQETHFLGSRTAIDAMVHQKKAQLGEHFSLKVIEYVEDFNQVQEEKQHFNQVQEEVEEIEDLNQIQEEKQEEEDGNS